jgi:perosamine synthetase
MTHKVKVPQFAPFLSLEDYKAILPCFEKNWITEGPKAEEFRNRLLEFINAKYGVFAPNGTLGLYLALKSIGITTGDEVIVPDFTFIGSSNAIEMTGATPVFVDVNNRNFQIDLTNADKLITPDTKAIMPVHIYGTALDMEPVKSFAKKHNLKIVEDAAQAIGVHYKGQHAGTFGDIGVFSFFADKTITTGEGGFIVTNNKDLYEKLQFLRNQGRLNRGTFIHPEIGYNFRMTDIQCAIGISQLDKFNLIKERKYFIKELYYNLLKEVGEIKFFEPEPGADWLPFRVAILCKNAHDLMKYLSENEIEPRTFFYPLHKQICYQYLKGKVDLNDENYPNSIYGYDSGICLPTFPSLTEEQVNHVCITIKSFYANESSLL